MKPPPVVLRRFRPEDLPALVDLFRDTIRRVNIRDYTREQVMTWAPDTVDPARWSTLADRFTIVAESDGMIVGFADLEPSGHLDRFFVHADRQGLGVGKAMIEAIILEARRLGLGKVYSEVSVTARPFFEGRGFALLAEREVEIRSVRFINYGMERRLDGEG